MVTSLVHGHEAGRGCSIKVSGLYSEILGPCTNTSREVYSAKPLVNSLSRVNKTKQNDTDHSSGHTTPLSFETFSLY